MKLPAASNLGVGAEVQARGSSGRSSNPGHGSARHGERLCVCGCGFRLHSCIIRASVVVLNAGKEYCSTVHRRIYSRIYFVY